jgi:hypothetical protein
MELQSYGRAEAVAKDTSKRSRMPSLAPVSIETIARATNQAAFGFAEIIASSFAHKKVKPSQMIVQPQTGDFLVLTPEKISNLGFNKN